MELNEIENSSWDIFNIKPYIHYDGRIGPDPRYVKTGPIAAFLHRIIEVESPVLAKRAYDIYLRGCGIKRMGGNIRQTMNEALYRLLSQELIELENESGERDVSTTIARMKGTGHVCIRNLGPRRFDEVPPSEVQAVARQFIAKIGGDEGSEDHIRTILKFYGLRRKTANVERRLKYAFKTHFPYVDELGNTK